MSRLLEWIRGHEVLVTWVGVGSLVFFVAHLLLMPVLVARIPAEYFATEEPPPGAWAHRRPLARLALRVLRNALGVTFLLVGLAMLVLPGQGLLTILVGLLLLDYPGKRRLELRALRVRSLRRALNWMRRRQGEPPLRVAGVPPEETL